MMKNIIGLMLIDAPHSALNNSGTDIGSRTENTVAVKKIMKRNKYGQEIYPYVSSQALRYWWRETLREKFNWSVSPLERKDKIAFTSANPFKYDDDDVFGYMRAQSKKEGGTVTRLSPLKCSPLVSVNPVTIIDDYGVMARHEGDPVPYEHEFYSTVLKGIFSLDVDSVGRFSMINKTGYKNITEEMKKEWEEAGAIVKDDIVELSEKVRKKRITDTIAALSYISGGAKQTLHLTDVTPKFIVLAEINCGNHLFMNVAGHEKGVPYLNLDALKEAIYDYKDSILTNIYIGKRKGFMDEIEEELFALSKFINEEKILDKEIRIDTVNNAINKFIEEIVL